jgi:hypothetical protein
MHYKALYQHSTSPNRVVVTWLLSNRGLVTMTAGHVILGSLRFVYYFANTVTHASRTSSVTSHKAGAATFAFPSQLLIRHHSLVVVVGRV